VHGGQLVPRRLADNEAGLEQVCHGSSPWL